jgi:hypothetical protein
MVIVYWIDKLPPTASGAFGDRWTFTIGITKPDGSNETLGPFTSDPVGGGWVAYTPTQVGTYTLQAHFPGKTITGYPTINGLPSTSASVNDTYAASDSDPLELIVQQEPIQPWPEAPLPTLFWTRPISEANRNWASLAANWLAGAASDFGPTARFNYGTAPESAHIMWATPMWAGGIMDARFGDIGYETSNYEGLDFNPPIILQGKIYYNVYSLPREGWYCLDLYTGETLFFHNSTGPISTPSQSSSGSIPYERLAFGQILNFECPNQHGGFPYLWSTSGPGSTWMMFDAVTGNYICSIANVSATGTNVYGLDGSILYYSISGTGANQYLRCWNTTQAIWWRGTQAQWDSGPNYSVFSGNNYWLWRPGLNVTYDGSHGFSLNVSLAANPLTVTTIRAVREDKYVIGGSAGSNNEQGITLGYLWCLSLKEGEEGRLLWNRTFTPPSSAGNKTINQGKVDPEDGVFFFECLQTRQRWGYSLETGQLLWGPSAPEPAMNYYGTAEMYGMDDNIYQGLQISYGYAGLLLAYNVTTGKIVWNYTASNQGFESPYGGYPISVSCIADGKLYLTSNEHSPTQPLWRGSDIRCINATDGTEIWKILNWGQQQTGAGMTVVADGFIVSLNLYDAQIYCYGKGPSATTVSASPEITVHGSSVLIKGSVTDQCVGAKKIAEKVGFTKGVPAVSDASQEAWMEWLYAQQGKPTDATGVDVSLDTVDPNGNYVHIATVTSDLTGAYGYKWTPEVPGTYQIIATFAGSAAYYGSYAQTYAGVDEVPPATAPPEYPQPIDPTMTIIAVGIAIAIAMIIAVVLVGIWIKRK